MQSLETKQELSQILTERQELIDRTLESYFASLELPRSEAIVELRTAVEYSTVRGGKRFRPILCLLLAEAFGVAPQRVLPFACALEMIHTYSLIHDDLPCMDNDDLRRGEPTNHKVFGEAMALLAGDALLTEGFILLASAYQNEPALSVSAISLLGKAAGMAGMIGGQAIDIKAQPETALQELNLQHALKTGALIRVACEATAVICGLSTVKVDLCRRFGENLGLAFQLKDDLLDYPGQDTKGSIPLLIGEVESKKYLEEISHQCFALLEHLGIQAGPLNELVVYNQTRSQ